MIKSKNKYMFLLFSLGFLTVMSFPVFAQNDNMSDKEDVFTYETELYGEGVDNDSVEIDGIDAIEQPEVLEASEDKDTLTKTYDTELYNRNDFNPDSDNPKIIADPEDVYTLDGNTRIITDDGESDIIVID